MKGTYLSIFYHVGKVRKEGQAIFHVLPCDIETRIFNVRYNFYSEFFHILQKHTYW
jgi:hypothetical protein